MYIHIHKWLNMIYMKMKVVQKALGLSSWTPKVVFCVIILT